MPSSIEASNLSSTTLEIEEEDIPQLTSTSLIRRSSRRRPAVTYFSSLDESEPFKDSGDSYCPSSNGDSDDGDEVDRNVLLVSEDDDEDDPTNATSNTDDHKWSPCRNLPSTFKFSVQHGIQQDSINLRDFAIFTHFITDDIINHSEVHKKK